MIIHDHYCSLVSSCAYWAAPIYVLFFVQWFTHNIPIARNWRGTRGRGYSPLSWWGHTFNDAVHSIAEICTAATVIVGRARNCCQVTPIMIQLSLLLSFYFFPFYKENSLYTMYCLGLYQHIWLKVIINHCFVQVFNRHLSLSRLAQWQLLVRTGNELTK